MNYTNGIPPGSLGFPASTYWFDAKILNNTSKYLTGSINIVPQIINGFNAVLLDGLNSTYENTIFDVFRNTFTDYTIIFGFKQNSLVVGATEKILFWQNNIAAEEFAVISLNSGGTKKISIVLSNVGYSIYMQAYSNNTYDDLLPHAICGIIDQSNKRVRLITETADDVNASNALYVSKNLQGDSPKGFRIGARNNNVFFGLLSAVPGVFGDVLIFNEVLTNSQINDVMKWECSRLGIVHTPI